MSDNNEAALSDCLRRYKAERALADDLANVLVQLASTMFMTHSVISRDEVDALLLRYREARDE